MDRACGAREAKGRLEGGERHVGENAAACHGDKDESAGDYATGPATLISNYKDCNTSSVNGKTEGGTGALSPLLSGEGTK